MLPPKFDIFWIFPNFLRSEVISCSATRDNSYTKYAILDIKFRFTCGESDPYSNIVKFQNIMTSIIAYRKELWERLNALRKEGKIAYLNYKSIGVRERNDPQV